MLKDRSEYRPEFRADRFDVASLEREKRVARKFAIRMRQGKCTHEENPRNHFCVYFAAYDPNAEEIFIGHHKKSDLWLFNGGHIDKGENRLEALKREMKEEWGFIEETEELGSVSLLTITEIETPNISCKRHYDFWYFIPVDKTKFKPKEELLKTEFHKTGWKSLEEAAELIKDPNTILAVNIISYRFLLQTIF